jgi:hypothetical protein
MLAAVIDRYLGVRVFVADANAALVEDAHARGVRAVATIDHPIRLARGMRLFVARGPHPV